MEKMIAVINDNLRNVVNGIKEHKSDLESNLDKIKKNMQTKIKEANSYKDEVENSRVIISALEQDITNLENDLIELTKKFDSKDFKEILTAGNKEINAKIIEKRAQISEQSRLIIELTEKAKLIKDELIQLKTKKKNTELNLHKTIALEKYYDLRIGEIVDYSESHIDDLDSYIESIPQNELITEDASIDDIDSVIDGKVFEEIDSISSSEPDEDLIKSALANPESIATDTEDKAIEKIEEIKVLSEDEQIDNAIDELNSNVDNKLEKMIDEAKMLIERNAEFAAKQREKEENEKAKEEIETIQEITEPVVEPNVLVLEAKEEGTKEDNLSETKVQAAISFDDNENEELTINDDVFKEENKETMGNEVITQEVPEVSQEVPEVNSTVFENDENPLIMSESMFNGSSDIFLDDNSNTNEEDSIEIDDVSNYSDTINPSLIVDFDGNPINKEEKEETKIENVFSFEPEINEDEITFGDVPSGINEENIDTSFITEADIEESNQISQLDKDLDELSIDKGLFNLSDYEKLENGFNKESVKKFLSILDKYGIEHDVIYSDVNILLNVVPEHLDQLLSLLIKTGMTGNDVKYIYSSLDKININKLEQTIMTSDEPELTSSIFESSELPLTDDLESILGLTSLEVDSIRTHSIGKDFDIIRAFPEVAKANYEQILKLHCESDKEKECIIKYPHRFTFAPSKFYSIIDKYDTEDLVRCINKNAAVIEKL